MSSRRHPSVSRILFTSEPGRPAALSEFSGRGDLRSYIRVMATREGTPIATTMLSSDTGKLYVALAQAIERLRK